jgi:hypothetical protein
MNRRNFFKALGLGAAAIASGAVMKLLPKRKPDLRRDLLYFADYGKGWAWGKGRGWSRLPDLSGNGNHGTLTCLWYHDTPSPRRTGNVNRRWLRILCKPAKPRKPVTQAMIDRILEKLSKRNRTA